MLTPTIILDNFFKNPNKIVEFSKTLEFKENENGEWPGERTENLSKINHELFCDINCKFLNLLYPIDCSTRFIADTRFQKISNVYKLPGWVHSDNGFFTFIVYLSNHKECGTSFYEPKDILTEEINVNQKHESYKNKNFSNGTFLKKNNSRFVETINIKSRFNRLIGFDSFQVHAAQKFIEEGITEDRLTLISFINKVEGNFYFSGVENYRKRF